MATPRLLALLPWLFVLTTLLPAMIATASRWFPWRTTHEIQATQLLEVTPSNGYYYLAANKPPGTVFYVPFDRLVKPFQLVPTAHERDENVDIRMQLGTSIVNQAKNLDEWEVATQSVFFDSDKIYGDGLLLFFPSPDLLRPGTGVDARSDDPFVLTYPVEVTPTATLLLWIIGGSLSLGLLVLSRPMFNRKHAGSNAGSNARSRPSVAARVIATTGRATSVILGSAGLMLTLLNGVGLLIPLRPTDPPDVSAPFLRDGSGDAWLSPAAIEGALDQHVSEDRAAYVVRINRLVAGSFRHIWNYGEASARRIHVPAWENFVLSLQTETDPQLYRYHYHDWRRALQRGSGMCGQVALVVVGILREHGIDARIVQLTGHTLSTALVAPNRWFLLDPDIGVEVKKSLQEVEANPEMVRSIYFEGYSKLHHLYPERAADIMVRLFGPEGNFIEPQGGNMMLGPVWIERELRAYQLKWMIPLLLLATSLVLLLSLRIPRLVRVTPASPEESRTESRGIASKSSLDV